MMWPNSTFEFRIFWIFWSLPVLMNQLSIPLPFLRLVFASGLPDDPICRLEALSIIGLLDAIGLFHRWRTCKNRTGQVHRQWPGFRHTPVFFFLFLHSFRHPFGAANQAEIFGAAERDEMADVEQTKKIVAFVTCEISFGQDVCELMCLVSMYLIWILGSKLIMWNNQTCLIVVLITASLSSNTYNIALDWEKIRIRKHIVNMKRNRIVVRRWSFGLILRALAWRDAMQQVSLCQWILGFIGLVWRTMEHFYNQFPKIQSWDTIHP